MRSPFLRSLLVASIALLLPMAACVDPDQAGGSTSGTALYVFDGSDAPASGRVLVWDDASALYADSAAAPTRTLKGSLLDQVKSLAWGGLCMDTAGNRLYLVSESGDIVRIERVRTQKGTLSATTDIVQFSLSNGSGDRLSSGKFGQASMDPGTGILYVTESNSTQSQIWQVSNPTLWTTGQTATKEMVTLVSGDSACTGIGAYQGSLYAYFGNGSTITDPSQTQYTGPRLRRGSAAGFQSFLIGGRTGIGSYGTIAVDSGNQQIFIARHIADSSGGTSPIGVFKFGTFTTGYNQAPDATLGDPASMNNLRILAHGGNKDWLAAATSSSSIPGNQVYLWRNPLTATTPRNIVLSGAAVRGLAFDGNN